MKLKNNIVIDEVQPTNDIITSRAGLNLFAKYINDINILPLIKDLFGHLRKSRKGLNITSIFHQLICYFADNTYNNFKFFDEFKESKSYAITIESEELASSHTIKRFFNSIKKKDLPKFRYLLKELFIWRVKIKKPEIIILGIDTMVMDNNLAKKKEGVKMTYKKVKGFQPLQVYWEDMIIDAIFRRGSKHSNHGKEVLKVIEDLVKLIRTRYKEDVPIIIRADAGFFDGKIINLCEKLKVGLVIGGKLVGRIKEFLYKRGNWRSYKNKRNEFKYHEDYYMCKKCQKAIKSIIMVKIREGKESYLFGLGKVNVILSNIGLGREIDTLLMLKKKGEYLETKNLIKLYHERGQDELVNKYLKNFKEERLPFKKFKNNLSYYKIMLISFMIFQSFKEDILIKNNLGLKEKSLATKIRRQLFDLGGKIIRHGRKIIMKIERVYYELLKIKEMYLRLREVKKVIL